jgi:hypothetical protein
MGTHCQKPSSPSGNLWTPCGWGGVDNTSNVLLIRGAANNALAHVQFRGYFKEGRAYMHNRLLHIRILKTESVDAHGTIKQAK